MSYIRPFHVLALAVFVVPGCAFRPTAPPTNTSSDRIEALLAASNAKQINMFGDLPDGTVPSFNSRAAIALERQTFSEVGRDFDPSFDPKGERMVFASTRHHVRPSIYMKQIGGVAVTQLTSGPASDIHPMFSPDGGSIAFASDRGGSWDIWIMSLDGGPPFQVTTGDADEVHPSWSPDGSRLIFCSLSVMSGQWELWVADTARRTGNRFIGYGLFPKWSPVKDTIVFQRAREQGDRRFSIWTITLVNGEPGYPVEIASSGKDALILPSWSPNGRQIAYSSSAVHGPSRPSITDADHGPFDIWIINADGTGNTRLTDGMSRNFGPTFSHDSRVFFASDRAGIENIWSLHTYGTGVDFRPGETLSTHGRGQNRLQTAPKVRTASDKDGF